MDIVLGEIIAERSLEWADGNGPSEGVVVRIGKPVQDTDPDGDWFCPIQILGLGRDHVRGAFGVDAVQALTLSFQMIHADLLAGQRQAGRTLHWLEQGDLGFLLPPARH